ncbi:hypothetical protein KBZ15_13555, partial [Cyanobium sp. BA20m-p-22]|nr:hypothetical protein [Cyanobium sp. BA20m-p-22]
MNSWEPWRPWGAPPATAACGEVLEWDEATYNAVKAELLSRRLIVPGRCRGGSVALADGSSAPRTRAPNGSRAATSSSTTPSSLEQAFRAIDDCLRKEAGCGTELDYTEQTSWLLFLKYLDGLEDDKAAGGRPGGPHLYTHPGGALPLEPLGGAEERQRPAGSPRIPHRRRHSRHGDQGAQQDLSVLGPKGQYTVSDI